MSLEYYADQNNWPSDLSDAKEFGKDALKDWKWKKKAPIFMAQIDRAKTVKRIQELVIYTLLSGEGLKVI